jgi:undecaprenyl diphosphate synthase
MDGNGRWAAKRGLKRSEGHREGVKAIKRVFAACDAIKIPVVSVFAFSTENWKRPKEEISAIFSLVTELNDEYLADERSDYYVNFFGDIDAMPQTVKKSVERVKEKTRYNKGMTVNIMLNYGGRAEIVRAAKKLADEKKEITEKSLKENLYTGYLPEPDLIVRTGGERRLSNFLTFQSAYSELYFVDTLWPDMDDTDVGRAVEYYLSRDRRFGGLTR